MGRKFRDDEEKRQIVEEYLSGLVPRASIEKKYKIRGHSSILNWIRQFEKEELYLQIRAKEMNRPIDELSLLKLENQQLHSRVRMLELELKSKNTNSGSDVELKKRVDFAEMKADAYDTMIDIAEEKFGIKIRKKAGAKL